MTEKQKEYARSKKGFITSTYCSQKYSSKKRGHKPPTYTKKELRDWLYSQPLFHHLHHLWKASNYDKILRPSIDRKDDDEGYNFSNIQLMTWGENNNKGYTDKRSGRMITVHKKVTQYTKENEFVAEFFSISEASRQTEAGITGISLCCSGKKKSSGGFIWKLSKEKEL